MSRITKKSGLEKKRNQFGYLFVLPYILGVILAVVYPVILSAIYSFGKIVPLTIGYRIELVGFNNYIKIFTVDPDYLRQLTNTLKTTIINVPVVVVFSFFLACILNAEFKGRGFARTVLFLPLILNSSVVVGLASGDAVSQNLSSKSSSSTVELFSGAFSEFLETMGVGGTISDILTSSVNNIGNILTMSVIPTIILLAGLQSVGSSLYEAAFVEGATAWEVLWKISLPIVSPLLLVSVVYCVIDSFVNNNVIISRVRAECFTKYNFGEGCAMAWSYLLVVLVIVGIVYIIVNRFVSYDN